MGLDIRTRQALSKLGFGPTMADLAEVERSGFDAWLAGQLRPPADDGCGERIAATRYRLKYQAQDQSEIDEERHVAVISAPIQAHWATVAQSRPSQERVFFRHAVALATLVRAAHSRWQLRELLVDFWHNHFNVNAVGEPTVAVALPTYDRDVIRGHALGNFREMLEAVASSAAMQVYLNNRSSRGGSANENYARELFELHTLGRPAYLNALYTRWRQVPGAMAGLPQGYIDQDVYEAARAFTGWTIEDGASLGGGRRLPSTGQFTYIDAWHDAYQKRVLATEIDPFQPPQADGRRVLDLLSEHPATARYVCGKLCRRLVSDTPSDRLVDDVAKVWTENRRAPNQIARTVEAIARSADFRRALGTKVKRPLELFASFVRATGIPLAATNGLLGELDGSGQRLFGWAPPTGHPDEQDYWLSSNAMRRRWSLLLGLADNAWGTGAPEAAEAVAAQPTLLAAVTAANRILLGTEPDAGLVNAIAAGLRIDPKAPFKARGDAPARARRVLAYCALSTPFQVR